MPGFTLFASPRRDAAKETNAVVVCIDRARGSEEEITDDDVQTLAAQLRSLAEQQRLGEYEGCDSFSSESRIYFFSSQAERLAATAMQLVTALTWRHKVKIRVSRDPRGYESGPLRP